MNVLRNRWQVALVNPLFDLMDTPQFGNYQDCWHFPIGWVDEETLLTLFSKMHQVTICPPKPVSPGPHAQVEQRGLLHILLHRLLDSAPSQLTWNHYGEKLGNRSYNEQHTHFWSTRWLKTSVLFLEIQVLFLGLIWGVSLCEAHLVVSSGHGHFHSALV